MTGRNLYLNLNLNRNSGYGFVAILMLIFLNPWWNNLAGVPEATIYGGICLGLYNCLIVGYCAFLIVITSVYFAFLLSSCHGVIWVNPVVIVVVTK